MSISLFFPVYGDEGTVRLVAEKALRFLSSVEAEYEIIIVDDGSPDQSGEIADALAREHSCIRVIHHPRNLGYGAALRSGLAACKFEHICMIDGDDEYDIQDFHKLLRLKDYYDLIITFRYKKLYSNMRVFISWVYNTLLRWMFRTSFRDVSTGIRLVRKSALQAIELESNSPFIGAEMATKLMLKGYRIGEVGIQTFPRAFGRGASTSVPNILATMRDMWRIYNKVFSDRYDLPPERGRS
ncbi:MAG: glycosyltransferase family 2 protein [Chloroflexota bacterium]